MSHTRLFQVKFNSPIDPEEDQIIGEHDEDVLSEVQMALSMCDYVAPLEYGSIKDAVEDKVYFLKWFADKLGRLCDEKIDLVTNGATGEIYLDIPTSSTLTLVANYKDKCREAADNFKESFHSFRDDGRRNGLCDGSGELNLGDTYSFRLAVNFLNSYLLFYDCTDYQGYPITPRGLLELICIQYTRFSGEDSEPTPPYIRIYFGDCLDVHY